MASVFDDFDLDVQKISTTVVDNGVISLTVILSMPTECITCECFTRIICPKL